MLLLSYEFVIVESVKPKEEEVVISDRKMKQLVKEAEKEAVESIVSDDGIEANDASVAEELIEREIM